MFPPLPEDISCILMINVQKRIAEKKAAAQSEFYKEQLQ